MAIALLFLLSPIIYIMLTILAQVFYQIVTVAL